ncbi:3'-5' exoribonuclease [Hoeflea sp. AS60]|uniref:3'-5' exoribonuclease domain-containing protein n=1 Tax=Hoeflea sp. AS60 TaxID=3135780 RepID=UPI003177084A
MKDEIYFSFDIEADGPVPGLYSMLSIGICVAGRTVAGSYVEADPEEKTMYLEMQPISEDFVEAAMSVNKLNREHLRVHGVSPHDAMKRLSDWILGCAEDLNPVLVAYPSTFDWTFLSYYFHRFLGGALPVSFTRVCDVRTMLVVKSQSMFYTPTAQCLPPELLVERAGTHNGLIDAIEQARLFSSIHLWGGKCE